MSLTTDLADERCRSQYEADLTREHQLLDTARAAAEALVVASDQLRWGDGTIVGCALGQIEYAITRLGLDNGDLPAPCSTRKRKKLPFRAVWDRDGWECQRCHTYKDLTVDHIVPVIAGGSDDISNLQTLCKTCNSSKGASLR